MDKVDQLEAVIVQGEEVECPLTHGFTKGWYIREVSVPAGTLLVSKIHRSCHPYTISKGKVKVMIDDEVRTLEAPFSGITEAGTRRVVYVEEDLIWTTFHRNEDDTEDLIKIEQRLIEPHDNPLLPEEIKIKNFLTQKL